MFAACEGIYPARDGQSASNPRAIGSNPSAAPTARDSLPTLAAFAYTAKQTIAHRPPRDGTVGAAALLSGSSGTATSLPFVQVGTFGEQQTHADMGLMILLVLAQILFLLTYWYTRL